MSKPIIRDTLPESKMRHYVLLDASFLAALSDKKQVNKLVYLFGTMILPAGVLAEIKRSINEQMRGTLNHLKDWFHIVKPDDALLEGFKKEKLARHSLEVLGLAKEAVKRETDVTICSSDPAVTDRFFDGADKQKVRTMNLCEFMTDVALWRMSNIQERENLLLTLDDTAKLQKESRERGDLHLHSYGNQLDKFMDELEILTRKRIDRKDEIEQTRRLMERQTRIAAIESQTHEQEHERGR